MARLSPSQWLSVWEFLWAWRAAAINDDLLVESESLDLGVDGKHLGQHTTR
jgi:hypothetical protein